MISLEVSDIYILDLKDDFTMNESDPLYEFIGKDIVKAYYLGYYVKDWFENLSREQQYLHSKDLRHIPLDMEQYLEQMRFWSDKFSEEAEVNALELAEYILNNIILFDNNDIIKIALFLGSISKKSEDNE